MTLRFAPRARDDLREIIDYIAKENPAGADRVSRAIFDACMLIAARPHPGIRNARAPELRAGWSRDIPTGSTIFVEDADVWIVHIRTFRAASPG